MTLISNCENMRSASLSLKKNCCTHTPFFSFQAYETVERLQGTVTNMQIRLSHDTMHAGNSQIKTRLQETNSFKLFTTEPLAPTSSTRTKASPPLIVNRSPFVVKATQHESRFDLTRRNDTRPKIKPSKALDKMGTGRAIHKRLGSQRVIGECCTHLAWCHNVPRHARWWGT